MGAVLKFKQSKVERQPSEQARVKVVRGPDYGSVFVIVGPKAVIGRGEDNDIVILDLKASRVHATIAQGHAGTWVIRDQGSANGILHNGQQTREALLRSGDTVTIGETTLEFMTADAATSMLASPARNFAQVRADQAAVASRIQSLGSGVSSGSGKMVFVLLGIGALLAFVLVPDSSETGGGQKASKSTVMAPSARDIASMQGEAPSDKSADTFFDIGFREYRQGNYLRARRQFETVLQVVPEHYLAARYLDVCDKRIEEEVVFHLTQGKKTLDAGKVKQARGHFESVLRLLTRNQSDPKYIEAKEQLDVAVKQIKAGGG